MKKNKIDKHLLAAFSGVLAYLADEELPEEPIFKVSLRNDNDRNSLFWRYSGREAIIGNRRNMLERK